MHRTIRLGAAIGFALLVAGAAHAAAYGKPYERIRPYVRSAIDGPNAANISCYLGPTDMLTIPVDSSFTTVPMSSSAVGDPCSRNDDGSSTVIDLPFTFHLYGQAFTQLFINNNGNVSFNASYYEYSSTGFPVNGFPMVAPFWADVDTRNSLSGVAHYRIDAHKLVVAWDHVGYYSVMADKQNTFELIISDGTDPVISPGNNVCFSYGDMQWTTGSASNGIGGFGGIAATVGINAGNGVDFFQIGRFDHAGLDYDGPGGNTDGVTYLSGKRFCANVTGETGTNIPPVAIGFPNGMVDSVCVGDTLVVNTSFAGPELNQTVSTTVDLQGLANATVASISGNLSTQHLVFVPALGQVGTHTVRYTAIDDGAPLPDTTIVDLVIVVSNCRRCSPTNHAPAFVAPTPVCGSTLQAVVNQLVTLQVAVADSEAADVVALDAAGVPATATLSTLLPALGNPVGTTLTWTPTVADTGLHVVTFTAKDGCDSTVCTFSIDVAAQSLCPHDARWWSTHRPAWPVDSLRLGNHVYDARKLADFLDPERRCGRDFASMTTSLNLARELVAAKFNLLIGAYAPAIDSVVFVADTLIGGKVLPFEVRCNGRGGRGGHDADVNCFDPDNDCRRHLLAFEQATERLRKFNDGLLTPNCHEGHHHGCGGDDRHRHADQQPSVTAPATMATGALQFSVSSRPNPFRGSTTIAYTLPTESDVQVAVFDLQGRIVRTLVSGHAAAGEHQVQWDGTDASGQKLKGGVYFYRVTAGGNVSGRKLIVQE